MDVSRLLQRAARAACLALLATVGTPLRAQEPLLDAPRLREDTVTIVVERLERMPDVAAAKWREGLPVTDPAREAAVLAATRADAAARGLVPAPVEALMALQVRLAREAQERLIAGWRASGCPGCDRAPSLPALRRDLDALGHRLMLQLYLAAPALPTAGSAALPAALQQRLEAAVPSAADRSALVRALAAVRLEGAPGLARIRAAGVLRIGTTGDYAPFTLAAGGTVRGADIELGRALGAALGVRVAFVQTTWPTLLPDLQRDAFDLALGGVSVTPERAAVGRFSVPWHAGGKTLLCRCADAARFAGLAGVDQPGVRVIVNPGGTNEAFVRAHVHRATILVHPDNRTVFPEIAEGRADVMVTDDVEAELQAARDPRLCRSLPGTLNRVDKAALMAPDAALAEAVDAWLRPRIAGGAPDRWLREAILRESRTP